jgi:hypothetical protein
VSVKGDLEQPAATTLRDGIAAKRATNAQTALRRKERAEAVPLELGGPLGAGGQRAGAREHGVGYPQDEKKLAQISKTVLP